MYLKQILFAKFGDNTFTVYKYKNRYLVRKYRVPVVVWDEYDSFAAVVESLKYFESSRDDYDDGIPF